MGIFNNLPTVKNCCFCLSLKVGSIIIAVFALLNSGAYFGFVWGMACGAKGETVRVIMDIMSYIMMITNIVVFVAAFVFIIGIMMSKSKTAQFFLYALAASLITDIVFIVLAILFSILKSHCNIAYSIVSSAISALLWFYFMMVVNSYSAEM